MSKGSFTYGGQANVNMQEIAFSIYTSVDSAFYDVEYPEHDWYKAVSEDQVLSDINAGATQYAFISRDRQGAAAFRGQAENNNIPMVSQTAGSSTVPLCASNVGAKSTTKTLASIRWALTETWLRIWANVCVLLAITWLNAHSSSVTMPLVSKAL